MSLHRALQVLDCENSHIGHVIIDCMRRTPEDICQIDAATEQEETNGSVLSRSIRLAKALRKFGLKPGDVLAFGGNNHLDLHIPYYAALLNGLPIVGVDPLFKRDEIKSLFKITKPKIAFCPISTRIDYEGAAHDLGLNLKIVTFEEGEDSMKEFLETFGDQEPENNFKVAEFDVENIYAFLISTSGTSGVLKVAAFKHRIVLRKFLCFIAFIKDSQNVRTVGLNLSPVQWISGIFNAFSMPIMNQIKLQTSKPDDVDHLIQLINKYKPDSMMLSPTLISILMKRKQEVDLSCFNTIVVTGAKSNTEVLQELRVHLQKSTLVMEAYGMTETLGPLLEPNVRGPLGSCGRPGPDYAVKLIDTDTGLEITEPFVTGELLAKGLCFTEYLGNPEETKNAFSEDGFVRTGDLLYKDENDYFFFVDRIKMLIKYRNTHIIPSELEEVILQHHGVQNACVIGVPDPEDGQHPGACVVRKPRSSVTAQEIKELVASKLSKNKALRGGVVFVDKIPLTSSGKMARGKVKEVVLNSQRE